MTDYQKYINALRKCAKEHENDTTYTGHIIVSNLCRDTANLLEALEQEPQTFKWCTDCREYDQEKHCCHRWSRVIKDTVEEMKQEYIERDVLDKIRAEITTLQNRCYALTKGTMCVFCKYECKYKAETEADNG